MNKLIIAAFATVMLFAGCSKKDNSNPSSSIVGRWHFAADTINVYDNGTLSSSEPQPFKSDGYVQFNSDGSGSESPVNDTVKFNYKITGSILTLNYPTQKIDGVTIDAETEQFTIKTLDNHTLFLYNAVTVLDGGDSEKTTEASHLTR